MNTMLFRKRDPAVLCLVFFLVLCLSTIAPVSAFAKKADQPAAPAALDKKEEAVKADLAIPAKKIADAAEIKEDLNVQTEEAVKTTKSEAAPALTSPATSPIPYATPPMPAPRADIGRPQPAPMNVQLPPPGFNPNPPGLAAAPAAGKASEADLKKKEAANKTATKVEDAPVKIEEVKLPPTKETAVPLKKEVSGSKKSGKSKGKEIL